jgi:hypothetical protein
MEEWPWILAQKKNGAKYEAYYIVETKLTPIKLWQRIQI